MTPSCTVLVNLPDNREVEGEFFLPGNWIEDVTEAIEQDCPEWESIVLTIVRAKP